MAHNLKNLGDKVLKFNWQPPLALDKLLMSGKVTDVISLNVDLVLECWLASKLKKKIPIAHATVCTKKKRSVSLIKIAAENVSSKLQLKAV